MLKKRIDNSSHCAKPVFLRLELSYVFNCNNSDLKINHYLIGLHFFFLNISRKIKEKILYVLIIINFCYIPTVVLII